MRKSIVNGATDSLRLEAGQPCPRESFQAALANKAVRAPVAIAGCGAVTAVGHGMDSLRSALHANTSGLRACARFDSPRFKSSIVGAVPQADDQSDDPAFQLANAALVEARERAAQILSSIPAAGIGRVL